MAEDLAPRISSLLTDLGPNPQQNIHTIVSKTCELLSCGAAVYACFEAGATSCASARHATYRTTQCRHTVRSMTSFGRSSSPAGRGRSLRSTRAGRESKSCAAAGPWLAFQSFIGQQDQQGDLRFSGPFQPHDGGPPQQHPPQAGDKEPQAELENLPDVDRVATSAPTAADQAWQRGTLGQPFQKTYCIHSGGTDGWGR
jgi:uncharacterized protein YciI